MTVARRVGTFHLAELAAVAQIDHPLGLGAGEFTHVAVVAIGRVEQRGKRRTQIEAEPASVTDVEGALEFLVESLAIPVFRFVQIVGKAVGRRGLDSVGHRGKPVIILSV